MTDGIIKGTGNSRYLKGPANAPALWSTHDAFMQAFAAGEVLIDLNGINPLGWDTIGDKLGKETLLKDETAQAAGLTADAVPDDVLAWLIGQAKGIRSIATGGTGNATGNAPSAIKLQTARTIQTNLASTSTAGFDGTANVTPGVTGVLPVANGGTGATTLDALANAVLPYISGVSKIVHGYYLGTGRCGANNKNLITFDSIPDFVYISCGFNSTLTESIKSKMFYPSFMFIDCSSKIGYAFVCGATKSWVSEGKQINFDDTEPTNLYFIVFPIEISGNIISWYVSDTSTSSAYKQLNAQASNPTYGTPPNGIYHYVAIYQ